MCPVKTQINLDICTHCSESSTHPRNMISITAGHSLKSAIAKYATSKIVTTYQHVVAADGQTG